MARDDADRQPRPRICAGSSARPSAFHARGTRRLLGGRPARRRVDGLTDNRLVDVDIREVVMPELQGAEEITVGAWNKKRGDEVAEGETLMEVHTDKVNAEIPSPFSGVVEDAARAAGAPGFRGQPT